MRRSLVWMIVIVLSVFECRAQKPAEYDYSRLNQQLLENDDFWKFIKRGNFPVDMTTIVIGQNTLKQVVTVFQHIQNTLRWDGNYGIMPTKDLRNTLLENEGSVADVNLILCALFRACGFDAYPVLLNVEGRGVLPEREPKPDDFNYVVCMVKVEDSFLLCDATSQTPLGLLPLRCLNRLGWMVNEDGGKMIDLSGMGKDIVSVSASIGVSGKKVKAKIGAVEKEYAAVKTLDEVHKIGELGQKEKIKASYPGWSFTKYKYDSGQNIASKEFAMNRKADGVGEIKIEPLLFGTTLDSVYRPDFSQEQVLFPVKVLRNYYMEMDVPTGYRAVLPVPIEMNVGKNDIVLRFQAMENEGKVIVSFALTVNKLGYLPAEYDDLKQFLGKLDEINQAVIILKK